VALIWPAEFSPRFFSVEIALQIEALTRLRWFKRSAPRLTRFRKVYSNVKERGANRRRPARSRTNSYTTAAVESWPVQIHLNPYN
jgi:hypothetical protein